MRAWEVPEFGTGWVAGFLALVVLLAAYGLVGMLGHRTLPRQPLPLVGVAFVIAGLISVNQSHPVPPIVAIGVAGVGAAASLADIGPVPTWVTAAVAAPCGWAIAFRGGVGVGDQVWIGVTVAVVASVGAVLTAATDHRWRIEAPTPALLALTVAGVYATVPDTEEAAALLGVVVPLALVGWPLGLARLGRAGAASSIAMLAWVVAYDGRGRPSSIVGSVACLGLLVGLPAGRRLLPGARRVFSQWRRGAVILLVLFVHLLVVAAGSRLAGSQTDLPAAVAVAAAVGVAATLSGAFLSTAEPTTAGSSRSR